MALEQVLFVHKELDVYKIPPRVGASGWRSGEWRVNDKIFTGRCRVVAQGPALEVRLEDPQTGELFGVAPVPPGQAHIAVEQAADSSRNFVLRLEDAASKRHAFVGISFGERSTAFDFNVAIQDHERQQRRADEMRKISEAQDPLAAASELMPEAAALYRHAGDLSLKEGETIKITVKKKEHAAVDGDSFLARLSGSGSAAAPSGAAAPGRLMPLAPPPGEPAGILPPPPTAAAPAAPSSSRAQAAAAPSNQQAAAGLQELLGWGVPAAAPAPAAAATPAPATEEGALSGPQLGHFTAPCGRNRTARAAPAAATPGGKGGKSGGVRGAGPGHEWSKDFGDVDHHPTQHSSLDWGDSHAHPSQRPRKQPEVAEAPPPPEWRQRLDRWLDRLRYQYFNWRQDTWSDLQLFLMFNAAVFITGAWVEANFVRQLDQRVAPMPQGMGPLEQAWHSLYSVLAVVLGQQLPENQAGFPTQLFAVVTAVFGLASFALVLTFVEQLVLEMLESNVKRGSTVYEKGHTVVLAWSESSWNLSQLIRVLAQLCAANRGEGGGVVVVLAQQGDKLEMEKLFKQAIPEPFRYGTQFVFRNGSPLDPAALRLVAATDAASVVLCSDCSLPSRDSDALVLRTAVLLDEMVEAERPDGGGPTVAAQLKTNGAVPMLEYACSERVVPVNTTYLSARRYARLLENPIVSVCTHMLLDATGPSHGIMLQVPELWGAARFGDLHFYFPDGIALGLHNRLTGECVMNPPPERRLLKGDEVVLLHPGRLGISGYLPLPQPVAVDPGNWSADAYIMRSRDELPMGTTSYGYDTSEAISGRYHPSNGHSAHAGGEPHTGAHDSSQHSNGNGHGHGDYASEAAECAAAELGLGEGTGSHGLFLRPVGAKFWKAKYELLICGWMGDTFMWELLRLLDHSPQRLPEGSRVTLFNNHDFDPQEFAERAQRNGIGHLQLVRIKGDPRSRRDMQQLAELTDHKAAIVLCDSQWSSGPAAAESGSITQADMLRFDAMVLMVQLNIRRLLEEAGHPGMSILTEKMTYVGATRFEDNARLPHGVAVNSNNYAAMAVTQVARQPDFVKPLSLLGKETGLVVQDASAFAAEDEQLSFLQLQARAAMVRQVLIGWYRIPESTREPLELVVNPHGLQERSQLLVWNAGDGRCKLITVATRAPVPVPVRQSEDKASSSGQAGSSSAASSSSGALGTKPLAAEGQVGTSSGAPGRQHVAAKASGPLRPRHLPVVRGVVVPTSSRSDHFRPRRLGRLMD